MAQQSYKIGSVGPLLYEDADFDAFDTDGRIRVGTTPTRPQDVVRLVDLNTVIFDTVLPLSVADTALAGTATKASHRDHVHPGVNLDLAQVITGTKTFTQQIISSLVTGTAPLSIASTTQVNNLNVSQLIGATWASPLAIGSITPNTGAFTTLSVTGQIISILATGTAPFSITSTTQVANLNVSQLIGATWIAPGTIGSTTPNTGAFTSLTSTIGSSFATSSGSVGIGTASPSQVLEVTSSAGNDGIIISGGGTQGPRFRINATGTGGRAYHLISSADGSGFSGGKFVITDNTASDAARLAIDSAGNIGVGTVSPGSLLEVAGTTRVKYSGALAVIQDTAAYSVGANGGQLLLQGLDSTSTNSNLGVIQVVAKASGLSDIIIKIGSSGSLIEVMRISGLASSANFGFGTTSPQKVLHVNGTCRIDGQASTGANIPTIGTNKPGSAVSLTPNNWLAIDLDGTVHYIPCWL